MKCHGYEIWGAQGQVFSSEGKVNVLLVLSYAEAGIGLLMDSFHFRIFCDSKSEKLGVLWGASSGVGACLVSNLQHLVSKSCSDYTVMFVTHMMFKSYTVSQDIFMEP